MTFKFLALHLGKIRFRDLNLASLIDTRSSVCKSSFKSASIFSCKVNLKLYLFGLVSYESVGGGSSEPPFLNYRLTHSSPYIFLKSQPNIICSDCLPQTSWASLLFLIFPILKPNTWTMFFSISVAAHFCVQLFKRSPTSLHTATIPSALIMSTPRFIQNTFQCSLNVFSSALLPWLENNPPRDRVLCWNWSHSLVLLFLSAWYSLNNTRNGDTYCNNTPLLLLWDQFVVSTQIYPGMLILPVHMSHTWIHIFIYYICNRVWRQAAKLSVSVMQETNPFLLYHKTTEESVMSGSCFPVSGQLFPHVQFH